MKNATGYMGSLMESNNSICNEVHTMWLFVCKHASSSCVEFIQCSSSFYKFRNILNLVLHLHHLSCIFLYLYWFYDFQVISSIKMIWVVISDMDPGWKFREGGEVCWLFWVGTRKILARGGCATSTVCTTPNTPTPP